MTWIEWTAVAFAACAFVVSTMCAIRLRKRNRLVRELRHQLCLLMKATDRFDRSYDTIPAHAGAVAHVATSGETVPDETSMSKDDLEKLRNAGIQGGEAGRRFSLLAKEPDGNNQAGHRLDAIGFGFPWPGLSPAEFDQVLRDTKAVVEAHKDSDFTAADMEAAIRGEPSTVSQPVDPPLEPWMKVVKLGPDDVEGWGQKNPFSPLKPEPPKIELVRNDQTKVGQADEWESEFEQGRPC